MRKEFLVQDFMSSPAVSVPASARLVDVALAMRRSATRHLLVVDGGRLVGLITDRDLQRCAPSRLMPVTEEAYNELFERTQVDRVMVREPRTIARSAPLLEAITIMQQAQIGCLPVMDGEQIVGIITRGDLVEALRQLLPGQAAGKSTPAGH
jgi:acetoin utilization protein AcuB